MTTQPSAGLTATIVSTSPAVSSVTVPESPIVYAAWVVAAGAAAAGAGVSAT